MAKNRRKGVKPPAESKTESCGVHRPPTAKAEGPSQTQDWQHTLKQRKAQADQVLQQNPEHAMNFSIDPDFGKITCKFTGHQVNANDTEFKQYVTTNHKYLTHCANEGFDFDSYSKFIVPHKQHPKHKMFCLITRREVNRNRSDLILHKNGKHFCKTMFETWRRNMLKAKKKLNWQINLAVKKMKNMRIKVRHQRKLVELNELVPSGYLHRRKHKQLVAISRLSLLGVKPRVNQD